MSHLRESFSFMFENWLPTCLCVSCFLHKDLSTFVSWHVPNTGGPLAGTILPYNYRQLRVQI
jgi:hypothetical protein